MTYYAYVHAKPNTNDATGIFYVGKGVHRRITPSVAQNRNAHHQNIVRKYGVENILVGAMECSSEEIAFDLEVGLIKCLRRMGVNLVNRTDGGEGVSGFKQPKHCSGENHPMKRDENRSKVSGDKSPTKRPEVREKMSKSRKARMLSEETLKAMSAAHKRRYESQAERDRTGAQSRGKKRINKDGLEKSVKPEDVEKYLADGWELGRKPFTRTPPSLETRKKISDANKGRKSK